MFKRVGFGVGGVCKLITESNIGLAWIRLFRDKPPGTDKINARSSSKLQKSLAKKLASSCSASVS